MTTMHEWELLLRGATEDALTAFQTSYRDSGDRGSLMNSGIALLDLGRLTDAIEVFNALRELEVRDGATTEMTMVMLGLAQWCARDTAAALRTWEASQDSCYADAAGGVQGLAMLWFGASQLKDAIREQHAIKLLRRDWKSGVADSSSWPGPLAIAGFLLAAIDEDRFLNVWKFDNDTLEIRRKCKAHFWAGAKSCDSPTACDHFQQACSNRMAVIEPEFFLARWAHRESMKQNRGSP